MKYIISSVFDVGSDNYYFNVSRIHDESTITIIIEDFVSLIGLKVSTYNENKINAVNSDQLIPISKVLVSLIIIDSENKGVFDQVDVMVTKEASADWQ